MAASLTRPLSLAQTSSGQLATSIPRFVYGTAWKKERTTDLVAKAINAGFVGVDTAAQPRHYQEDLVGEGIRQALAEGKIKREDLYIQTKYTPPAGQDPSNLPYDPSSPVEVQVHASIASSLHHLRTSNDDSTYIDTVVIHSPLSTIPLTLTAWRTLETYVPHRIRGLGVSNTDLPTLQTLYKAATVKPAVVQNRFFPQTRYDVPLRRFCEENGIIYQSFWTLTGNPHLVKSAVVAEVARMIGTTNEVSLYLCVMGLGKVVVLNGTTNEERMREDLNGLEMWTDWYQKDERNREKWQGHIKTFRELLGDS
ncbi:hypothetical protein MMC08_003887 [Hypocenomyce scalaris]|nr:hypothetical protein [Hypocenomyce scalaris]